MGNVAIKVNINSDDESLDRSLRGSDHFSVKANFVSMGREGFLGVCWCSYRNQQLDIQVYGFSVEKAPKQQTLDVVTLVLLLLTTVLPPAAVFS